jgi:curved DNA-binding protein CbpA
MDLKKCYEVLELLPDASLEEAKQAYKDLVNIWHPDRFSHNPRLKQKAEEKLKEVNVAYKKVEASLSSKHSLESDEKEARAAAQAESQASPHAQAKAEPGHYERSHPEYEARDKTEAAVEIVTGIILGACSYVYSSLRRFVADQVQNAKAEIEADAEQRQPTARKPQGRGYGREKNKGTGRGGGMQRGRGMGRGRGKGMRRGRGRGSF